MSYPAHSYPYSASIGFLEKQENKPSEKSPQFLDYKRKMNDERYLKRLSQYFECLLQRHIDAIRNSGQMDLAKIADDRKDAIDIIRREQENQMKLIHIGDGHHNDSLHSKGNPTKEYLYKLLRDYAYTNALLV